MDWPRPSYTFGHEERPQDPPPVRLTKNSIPKNPVRKTEWRKEHVRLADLHTSTLLTVVFGLTSKVNDAFGGDISFVVVTRMAFILNASPPFSLVLPRGLHAFLFSLLFIQNAVE
jgi:hypothetical protein